MRSGGVSEFISPFAMKTWLAGLAVMLLEAALRFTADADLAAKLRARNPRAMATLYKRYGKAAYSLILRIVHDRAAAEHLVQETFLRIWNRAHSFDRQRGALGPWILALGPWILMVARNLAIDHVRLAGGRGAAGAPELSRLERTGLFTQIEHGALSIDRSRRLKAALEKLPPDQRTAIEAAYFEGLSHTEMAERIEQPPDTVKTWVRTALKTLRQEIGEPVKA
jgi:RNA polymerase sigma-70 factor, ECF subfamily